MAALARMVLAVVVITGWVLALTWLAISVSQITVLQVVSPTLCVPSQPWAVACSP
jgi:hypothetical protein